MMTTTVILYIAQLPFTEWEIHEMNRALGHLCAHIG